MDCAFSGGHPSIYLSGFHPIFFYYVARAVSLTPLAMPLIFVCAVLCVTMNLKKTGETAALLISGLKPSQILFPFLLWALITGLSISITEEWLKEPLHRIIAEQEGRKIRPESAFLQDGSLLFWQTEKNGFLHEVFWIRRSEKKLQEIWMMQSLDLHKKQAFFVDILEKKAPYGLEKTASYKKIKIAKMPKGVWNKGAYSRFMKESYWGIDSPETKGNYFAALSLSLLPLCLLFFLSNGVIALEKAQVPAKKIAFSLSLSIGCLALQMVTKQAIIQETLSLTAGCSVSISILFFSWLCYRKASST